MPGDEAAPPLQAARQFPHRMEVITMPTTDPDTHGGIPPGALEQTG
jgi:hypothetical protein